MLQNLDATGLDCPLPLLKAKQCLNALTAGDTLRVLATDAGSQRDFRVFCELSGNRLVESSESKGIYSYLIQKG
jgi:TusA-related sulfurtransferase